MSLADDPNTIMSYTSTGQLDPPEPDHETDATCHTILARPVVAWHPPGEPQIFREMAAAIVLQALSLVFALQLQSCIDRVGFSAAVDDARHLLSIVDSALQQTFQQMNGIAVSQAHNELHHWKLATFQSLYQDGIVQRSNIEFFQ